jgi:hypothetical protein
MSVSRKSKALRHPIRTWRFWRKVAYMREQGWITYDVIYKKQLCCLGRFMVRHLKGRS